MSEYKLKQTAAEVQEILDNVTGITSPAAAELDQVLSSDGNGGTEWRDSGGDIDDAFSADSDNPLQNKVITKVISDDHLSIGRDDTKQIGTGSGAIGEGVTASGNYSFATAHGQATGEASAALGYGTASGAGSHSDNYGSAAGACSNAENYSSAAGPASHSESYGNVLAAGLAAHAEGYSTASAESSHGEGHGEANGKASHAEGYSTAGAEAAHSENYSEAAAVASHSEGYSSASGKAAHSEGYSSASGEASHSEGRGNAGGDSSHAEGTGSAPGARAHAEGESTAASGVNSHAGGLGTTSAGAEQTVIGRYNISDDTSAFIVGNGSYDASAKKAVPSNCLKLDFSGNLSVAGTVTDGTGKALVPVASPALASSGQVLTADGSGGTSWAAGGGGSGAVSSVDGKTGAVTLTDTYLGLAGGTLTGTLNIGTTDTTVYTGVCTWRKCANDSGNVHQAAFFVNSDGTAKFVNRGASGSSDTAALTFGAGGFKFIMGTSNVIASIDTNGGVTLTGELTGPDHTGGTATFGYLAENAKTTEIFMSAGEVTIASSAWTASTDAAGYYEAAAVVDGMCTCYHQMTLIAASGIVPTETERTEFKKIVHITDADSTTLKLYATAAPTCDLNIAISGTYVLL